MAKSQRKTARSADGKAKTDAHTREQALERREAELAKREETVRERIADLARAEQELEDHRHRLAAALPPPPATPEPALAPSPKTPPPATARRSVPLVLGAAIAVVAATLTYTAIAPTYDVRSEWQRTDGAPLPIEVMRDIALASQASPEDGFDVQGVRWIQDETTATVVATFRTRDPVRFSTAINTRAHAALPAIAEALFPDAPAADTVATLMRQRDALRDELAALPPTDTSAEATVARDELDRLLADMNELAAAREATSQELARVQTAKTAIEQPASRPTTANAGITPDEREQAFAADRELSQASQRLTAELTAIRAHLNEAITAARPKLGEARRGLDAFLQETRTQREAPPDTSAETELDAIGAEANRLAGQIATLDETLAEAETELTRIADPTMTQRAIETAVKAYTAASGAAMASLTQRVQALGDGGEQLTKRLVARSA
ncbi:MAG: hypothetical protein JXA69_17510, partial [Phycisphaerae bacterium]|nr:hypothetical protein [Phycisphaerae bacterium]